LETSDKEKKIIYFHPDVPPPEENNDWKVVSSVPLLDWILDHHREFGVSLQLISDQTNIGSQFVKSFGGLGGMLRYEVDLPSLNVEPEDEEEYFW